MVRSIQHTPAPPGPHPAVGDARLGPRSRGLAQTGRVLVTGATQPESLTLREWDHLVETTARSDVAQLSAWADVRRQAGFTPMYLLAHAADRVVGGALVLQRRVPGLGVLGYLPYGPVLPAGHRRDEAAEMVCTALTDLAGRQFAAMFVQPADGADDVSRRLLRRGFRESTAGIAPAASIELDLSRPTRDLHRDMRSGTRAGVRGARKAGIRVREAHPRDLPVVADLLAQTAAHQDFPPPSLTSLQTLHRRLTPNHHLKIFIAEQDGVALATDVLTACGGVLKLRQTGMRRSDDTRRSGAPALLRWETALWAKANGFSSLDLGGIDPSAVDAISVGHANLAARVNGRTYYKASFGGHPFHYPTAVELIPSKLARLSYDVARQSTLGSHLLTVAKQLLRGTRAGRLTDNDLGR